MERRIEDAMRSRQVSASVHALEPALDPSHAPTDAPSDNEPGVQVERELRVITREGDLAVIRDLRPDGEPTEIPEAPALPVAPPLHVPDGATKQRYRMLVAGHVASDIFCVNVMLLATELLDDVIRAGSLAGIGWLLTILGSVAWVAIFHSFGLYASRHMSSSEEIRRVVGATSVGAALLLILGAEALPPGSSSARLGLAFAMVVILEVVTRLAWRRYARSLRSMGLLAYRTVILGSACDAASVAKSLDDDDRSGFFPVGRIAPELGVDAPGAPPFLGLLADAARLVDQWSVEALIVASPTLTTAELARLQQLARREGLALRLVARVPHMLTNRLTLQRVGPLMTVAVRPAQLTGTQAALKRAFDISIASVGIVLSAPIQLVVGLLVGITSPGPVLFRQKRVTRGNALFTVFKFRTMDRDADRIMDERAIDRTQPFFKGGEEPPVTPVGRVLRTLSLDELPQLWNVLIGDMSLVGPRPIVAAEIEKYGEHFSLYAAVKPGITGLWQVSGRNNTTYEERIRLDSYYVRNWSLGLDFFILMRTMPVVLRGEGAY